MRTDCLCGLCTKVDDDHRMAIMTFEEAHDQARALLDLHEWAEILGGAAAADALLDDASAPLCLPAARLIWQQQCDSVEEAPAAAGLPEPSPVPEARWDPEDESPPPPPPPVAASPSLSPTAQEEASPPPPVAVAEQGEDVSIPYPQLTLGLFIVLVLACFAAGLMVACCYKTARSPRTKSTLSVDTRVSFGYLQASRSRSDPLPSEGTVSSAMSSSKVNFKSGGLSQGPGVEDSVSRRV